MMLIALIIVSIMLVGAISMCVIFWQDARFYNKLYHDTDRICNLLIGQNKRLIDKLLELHKQDKDGDNYNDEQYEE